MLETSPSVAALAEAMALAQAAVEGATKGKVNPAFKSKYADLKSVWDACREALTQNGLSVIQSPGELENSKVTITTMLLHKSGEWVRGSLSIPIGKVDAQGYGSAITYARRFALAAFVGVAPEDDDGAAAAKSIRQTHEPLIESAKTLAMNHLRSCAIDGAMFKETWTKNYAGWKAVLSDEDYAELVAEMKKLAAKFTPAKPAPPADEFGMAGDQVPEFA
jgi:hypothetical protein